MRDQVLYRHRPTRSLVVGALFAVPPGLLAARLIASGERIGWMLAVVGVFLVVSTLRRTASVRVGLSGERLVWEHVSLPRGRRRREFRAGDIADMRRETVSAWRGIRSERLVFELKDGDVLEVSPFVPEGERLRALMETLDRLREVEGRAT